ncbi:MAG TPA: phytanoyl-CoA dioxygenase family protein [Pyrinomonadaceae bacterium]|nr:phytanoyl-CoA dioxygenase family protein [Pyrinomonadaceae bacterium]
MTRASLTKSQLDRYHRDGIVFPIEIFSAAESSLYRQALESIAAQCTETSIKRFDNLHLFFDWAYNLVTDSLLLNAVESLLGSEILVDGTLVFYKPPRDSSYVSWHQDSVYSGWNLSPSTSAWIALTPSCSVNGCMRVIPGSHKEGLLAHDNVRDDPNLLNRRGERINRVVDEGEAIDVTLEPGEMSLHHSTLIHASNANDSDEPRIGFIVRFVTDQFPNRGRSLLRVRGEADCSHLRLAQPPPKMDQASAILTWRAFDQSRVPAKRS